MKKIFYTLIFLLAASVYASAQLISTDKKWKNNFLQHISQHQNFRSQNQNSSFRGFNPYWKQVNVPHLDGSYIGDMEVPTARDAWGQIGIYTEGRPSTIYYVLTQDGGYSWKLDSLPLSTEYGISSFSPIDGYTCYAAVANDYYGGGGIYKTNNGGKTWRQLSPGQLFDSTSFPDFVHFWDEKHGVAVGDGNGPGDPYLEIYTTSNAGATWKRVPKENIPTPNGFPYSFNNAYYVAGNRIWFQGFDSNGGHFMYRSDDYGHHWQAFPLAIDYFFDFAFINTSNGLASTIDDNGITGIYKTRDGGITWKNVEYSGIPFGLFMTAIPGTSTYVSTSSFYTAVNGSSYSNDNGKTWILIDSGANALHDDVKFLNPFIGWSGETEASSSDPGGMFAWRYHFSLDGNAIASDDENISSATANDLSNTISAKLYPNPAKDAVIINGLNPSAKTIISLFNISGKLVQQSTSNGESYQLNIQKLAAGSYYVQIQSGEKTATLKFVKQ